ncbi:DNA internalization-related competence protein ComEC/Rec2 [Domibacillus epiphyticus]|uniref:DNA internalization-related competence protein ComEC/Rec2 n=1 Tax=Domibacillus epiphyticus TaxID=1714355 RepID=A0A1V2A9F2_9BACI|nr:DNA internalization-related competence protein ComEC/Rec2 [Domibacillus epiphyticus]OMP67621.1 DNA internalization-related competence protein ComEC/Rec2 [Domibacillus epiphyticus]
MQLLRMGAAALTSTLAALEAPYLIIFFLFALSCLLWIGAGRHHRMLMTGALVVFYGIGLFHQTHHMSHFTGDETEWTVVFSDDLKMDGDRLNAGVDEVFTGENLRLSYRMKSEEEKQQLASMISPGLTCRIRAEAVKPNEARNTGEFNYRTYLSTIHTFYILSPESISKEHCTINDSIHYAPARWRIAALQHVYNLFPEPLNSTAAALLFGDRTSSSESVNEDYEQLGIVHILSISGLHVTMMTGLIFFVLIRAGITREQARFIILIFLPLYALLTGASPPVVRACFMTGSIIAAISSHVLLTPASALGAAFLVMLAFDPYLVFQAGFQLSYVVTLALVLSSGVILKRSRNVIELSLAVSVISQMAALPFLIYHFSELSIIAPFANLLFVPFYSVIMMPALFAAFVLSFFMPVNLLTDLANLFLKMMDSLAAKMADLPFAVVVTGQPDMEWILIACTVAISSFILWEKKETIWYSLILCGLLIGVLTGLSRFSSEGEVTFIDVGQGDSIFIRLPYGKGTYLIDTGGRLPFEKEAWADRSGGFSVGKDTVVPFLKRKGVTKLDKLILTHADYDHAGAAAEVLSYISADEIIISPGSANVDVMKEILAAASDKKIRVREGFEGEQWTAGGSFFHFLSPNDRNYEGNNDSLVLYASIGGENWLFTGDFEEPGEQEFQKKYKIDVDWLKVGHHGSRTSTSDGFVKSIKPEFAVISAGVDNRYGHPHKEVLENLSGVYVYRTDQHGSISYTFKGEHGIVSTAIQPE